MFSALSKWRDARRRLDDAIQCYLESIASLDSNLFDPYPRSADGCPLDNIVFEVREDSNLLDHRLANLRKGRAILNRIQNKSVSLVPTNKLPCEVLLRIFHCCALNGTCAYYDTSSMCFDRHYKLKTLYTLTHVCADWRAILLGAPSFWSHIDEEYFSSKSDTKISHRIRLSLERAGGHPLCIDLDGLKGISKMVKSGLLQPYIKNLQTVYWINQQSYDNLLEFLSFWLTNAQTGTIRSLMIWQEHRSSFRVSEVGGDEHANYLAAVRVLRLNAVHFAWDSPAYHNLAHLQLGGITHDVSPTLQQMLAILSACPELHTLQLVHMSIKSDGEPQLQPVVLKRLSNLELVQLGPFGMRLLLPMLVPQPGSLSLRIDLYTSPPTLASYGIGSAVLDFLARNNVTRLFISSSGSAMGIVEYLSAVPNLTTLILGFDSYQGDEVLAAVTESPTPLCPALRTLYLDNGALRSESVERLLKAYPLIKKLRITHCTLDIANEALTDRLGPLIRDVELEDEGLYPNSSFYWYHYMI